MPRVSRRRQEEPTEVPVYPFYKYTPLKEKEPCAHPSCKLRSKFSMRCYHCKRIYHPDCVGLPDADFKHFTCLDCFLKIDE